MGAGKNRTQRRPIQPSCYPTQGALHEAGGEGGGVAHENQLGIQQAQEQTYNQGASLGIFQLGDQVLLLLPSTESKLLARYQGLLEVVHQIGPVD